MMNPQELKNQLEDYETKLINAPRWDIIFDRAKWKTDIPNTAGVYVIWDVTSNSPVYVGETCHLNHRLHDDLLARGHPFISRTGEKYNIIDKGQLNKFISEGYLFSFLEIPFGRIEVQEYLILKWAKIEGKELRNKRHARLELSGNYSWL